MRSLVSVDPQSYSSVHVDPVHWLGSFGLRLCLCLLCVLFSWCCCVCVLSLCTVLHALCTMHLGPCTVCHALCAMHFVPCTVHHALFVLFLHCSSSTEQLANLQTSSALALQVNRPAQPSLGQVKGSIIRSAGSIQANIAKLRSQQIAGGFKVRGTAWWSCQAGEVRLQSDVFSLNFSTLESNLFV